MANQLIAPNLNISCTPGMCLVYVRETFGIGPKYPTATVGWKASNRKHKDRDFPAGIWTPIWFKLKDNPDGHVALRQPDGSVWSASDPKATMPVHHPSLDDLESYYGGRLTYLGWTEDIEDVLVMVTTQQPDKWSTVIAGRPHPGGYIPPVVANIVFEIRNGKLHKVNNTSQNGIVPDLPPPAGLTMTMPMHAIDGGQPGSITPGGHG